MTDAKLRLQAPERLLDRADSGGLARILLRSSDLDAPPRDALERALLASSAAISGVAMASTAAAASSVLSANGAAAAGVASGASSAASVGVGAVATSGAVGTSAALSASFLAKSVVTWVLAGCVLGAVGSGTALELSTGGAWRRPALEVDAVASQRVLSAPKSKQASVAQHVAEPARSKPPEAATMAEVGQLEVSHAASRAPLRARGQARPSTETESAPLVLPEKPVAESTPASVNPDFSKQLSLIDAAREQLRNGNASGALELVQRYLATYPKGQLQPEALAVAVEAALKAGHTARARTDGARFLSAYPHHPLAARVRALLASP